MNEGREWASLRRTETNVALARSAPHELLAFGADGRFEPPTSRYATLAQRNNHFTNFPIANETTVTPCRRATITR